MAGSQCSGPRSAAVVAGGGRQAPVQDGGGVVGVAERGGGGLVQGRDGVVSFDGQQGEVAAQHGPGLGVGEVVAQLGGGGVDAGHEVRVRRGVRRRR